MTSGVSLSLVATLLFAGIYYYAPLLAPLSAEQVFGWRMLLTVPCVTVFLVASHQWNSVRVIVSRIGRSNALAAGLLLSSAMLGLQQWLFMWAPINGRAIQVALGYCLMPLSMLLAGRVLYGERLTALQKIAAVFACLGSVNQFLRDGGLSWEVWVVALGFPAYFILRRKLGTDSLGGLWFDMSATVPVATWFIMNPAGSVHVVSTTPRFWWMIPVLGIMSAAAYVCYSTASRWLPLGLFGLLGYAEPVLLLVVSVVLGERVSADDWLTYLPICVAMGLLAIDGTRRLWKSRGSSLADGSP